MGVTVREMNLAFLKYFSTISGKEAGKSRQLPLSAPNMADLYGATSFNATLRQTVNKMQTALSVSTTTNSTSSTTVTVNPTEMVFGVPLGSEPADNTSETDTNLPPQETINLQQAREIARQLGLGADDAWGIESVARDLAVFGLDLTAINTPPDQLIENIRNKSIELLDKLDTGGGTDTERRQITGASSRLTNGLRGSGAFISTSLNVTSFTGGVTASINGVDVNASALIAVGNIIVDPLVFDLNGDGIDLKGADEGVDFDMNGDGTRATMGFIRGDDAFLFIDSFGDGIVHDGRQLFGNTNGYANGFEMLRAYDDNGDGIIDENDAIWEYLRLWVEKNEDGICEYGETMSLAEAGITSINLGYRDVREDDGKGNLFGQIGSFTRADGSEGLAADVWLQESRDWT